MKKQIIYTLFFIGVIFSVSDLYAQTVTGVVSDVNGPLPGVSILVKGTSIGSASDFDGNYIIDADSKATLVFSYIGFITKEIPVSGISVINVVLVEDSQALDEVVVVGYGTQKKSDVTGAVTSVNIETFEKTVSPYATQALQGLVSGVTVTSNTGAPGEGAQIRIRGIGSITGGNTPLYIVDGVPTKNAMDYLSPLDIENISVLKDAASSAIYGSRANNGVVIITTKKGKKGRAPKITFSSLIGVQKRGNLTEMTNKEQYIELYNEAADNDNALLPPDQAILFRKKISSDYAQTLPNINYLDAIFREANLQQYHVGFSGSSEKTNYNISGGYFNQEGILLGSSYNKVTGKISVNTEVKSWLNIGTNINIYKDENHIVGSSGDGFGGNGGSAVRYAFFRTGAIPIYDTAGEYVDLPDKPGFFGDGYNPVGLLNNQDNVRRNYGLFGDINFKVKFSDQLFLTSTFGLDRSNYKQRRFNKTWGKNSRINNPNSLVIITNLISNWSLSNVLNYNHTFNKIHNFTAILGVETIDNSSEAVYATDRDFPDQNRLLVNLGNGKGIKTTNESSSENKLQSFFGRGNYNYNEKYFVSALLRRDGSSRFKDGNRWGTFYSASLGWRIDKDFFQDNDFLNSWMLRLGYGSVGDQEIPNFSYLELIGKDFNYPFGNISQLGSTTVSLGNENAQWATSNQIDIGTDISLFQGKLKFVIDYYHKTTENMLLKISIPSSSGYANAPVFNSGKVLNSGFEFEVNYNNRISKNFSYSVKGNAALLHNEVLELNNPILGGRIDNSIFATKTEVGYSIGSFYLYEMEGIFQNETDVITHAYQGNNILPGDVKYKDQNGDGLINDLDRSHVGSPIPDVTFGLITELNYKNVDLSIFIAGAYGQELYYQIATDIEGFYRPFNVTKRYYDERWTGEGTSNTQPRASWSAKGNNTKPSTRFLEDGSFIRVKNIQLGYNFGEKVLTKIKMDKLRIYTTASNLFTLTKYHGLDPEFSTSDNSKGEGDLASGIDWGTYPNALSVNIGVQLTF
ncbi:MAG: SusC/RagA family TonB-linked outer membrane protein [Flavobacteriaceae bacterium]|nr:MAG: SusC/RagA family TonB-linked outer membrane protein [Flavobacteriaceae bacterium]